MNIEPKERAKEILERVQQQRKRDGDSIYLDMAEEIAKEVLKTYEWLEDFKIGNTREPVTKSVSELEAVAFDVKTEDEESARAVKDLITLRDGR